jgi:hypothetical protein
VEEPAFQAGVDSILRRNAALKGPLLHGVANASTRIGARRIGAFGG